MTNHPLFQPNTYFDSEKATSSTFVNLTVDHSILTHSSFFNCLFHQANMEGSAFADVEFGGSVFDRSSLRNCRFVNCDVEGLIINGVPVGELIKKHTADSGPFIPATARPDLAHRLVQDRGRELARSISAIVHQRRAEPGHPKDGKDGKDAVYDGSGATIGIHDGATAHPGGKSIELGPGHPGGDDTGKESSDKGKDAKDIGDKEGKEKDKEKDKDDKEPDVAKLGGDEVESPFSGDPFIRYGNPAALHVKSMEQIEREHAARFGRVFVAKPIL